ncbi:MAG: glucose-1-phosphate cytidylyltransferase [Syntrophorhabdales bacterium]|jgi:glucose-1-phosphate cytidylyltransferase
MKVVLFCGGLGTRLREYSETIPKPMVEIGYRPILWHVMKYYAYYGHKDFILCLGYKSDVIKNYFLNYNECLSNNFVLSNGCKEVTLLNTDIDDWRITFVDTGLHSNIGQRLRAVEEYLEGEEVFLANYSDGLSDAPLPDLIDYFVTSEKTASFLSVRPTQSFHVVSLDEDGEVEAIRHIKNSGIWINGGFFVFRKAIFRYINDGEELVNEPFQRLIERGKLTTYKHTGFWVSMDTFKDKQLLDDMCSRGETPWEVWKNSDRRECAP